MLRIGSLFSGAGGLDMAVEAVFDARVAWHSEIDPGASKVLAHHWPEVPNLGDITQIGWDNVEPVDIICGGFPCQDVSAAGKRAGIKDGTRSGLWSIFADAIEALRPPIVIIENVRGLLSAKAHRDMESNPADLGNGTGRPILRAAGAVLGDLADLGYDAQWVTYAAGDIGAPHRRERVFILATATNAERRGGARLEDTGRDSAPDSQGRQTILARGLGDIGAKPSDGIDLLPTPSTHDKTGARSPQSIARMGGKPFSNLNDTVVNDLLPTPRSSDCFGAGHHGEGGMDLRTTVSLLPTPRASDPKGKRNPDGRQRDGRERTAGDDALPDALARNQWGKYAPAIARWEALTRPAPAPTEPNKNGNPRLAAQFSEWMMGWPSGHVTDPAIGLSRNDQLRIVGNGVCPQQAQAAIRYLAGMAGITPHTHTHTHRERADVNPLLPTPKAHDGVFATPRTSGRPIEKSTHLQTIVSLMPFATNESGATE